MERVLFLMIPPFWGALVLGMGLLAHWSRKRELKRELGVLTAATERDAAEQTEKAFY